MNNSSLKWFYLIGLSLVWGSSFILMKYALLGLNPLQVGSLRMIITALVLIGFGFNSLKSLSGKDWKFIGLSASIGTFFPVFLFAIAIYHMDSAIAAILNSLVPFFALIIGASIFGFSFKKQQVLGILIGLIGTILLILSGKSVGGIAEYKYPLMILTASIGYAFNVNIVKRHLQEVKPIAITTGTFVLVLLPALLVLATTDFFKSLEWTSKTQQSLFYIVILSVIGTAVAKVFFNKLVQISTPIFSTSVTYLIPLVAVFWGFLDGERLTLIQILSGGIILLGVYLVNRKR